MTSPVLHVLTAAVVALPLVGCALLGLLGWFGAPLSERLISRTIGVVFASTAICALGAALGTWISGVGTVQVELFTWFVVDHYHFRWGLLGDALSLPFAVFAAMLVGLIGAFSERYLHREAGFYRFYLMLCVFGAGVEIVVLSAGLDQLFFGWELVGLSSALLIAFFHERPKPVEHGMRAFVTYRICDVGLLGAAVWLHHTAETTAFQPGAAGEHWAGMPVAVEPAAALVAGLLVLWASMGKSAQAPIGGWLPRAMEGPTPSSAIFYGAISIHLGPYLLLRAAPVLDAAPAVAWAVAAVGLATALHASFVGRVQTDIKSVLAYASMAQVGIIFVEIGLGLRVIPLVHIVGHATIRSLEILRSPSLLQDYRHLEQAIGRNVPRPPLPLERLFPKSWRPWLYRHALERGYFDALLRDYVVAPFLYACRLLDRVDRALVRRIEAPRAPRGEKERS